MTCPPSRRGATTLCRRLAVEPASPARSTQSIAARPGRARPCSICPLKIIPASMTWIALFPLSRPRRWSVAARLLSVARHCRRASVQYGTETVSLRGTCMIVARRHHHPNPQDPGVNDEWRPRRRQAWQTTAAPGGDPSGVRRVQDRAARDRPDPGRRAEDAPVGVVLAVVRRGVQRGVLLLRHADHVLRPGRAAGGGRHPDRQSVLRAARAREPAGTADGYDRVHGQPGAVRAEREPDGGAVQLGDAGRVRDRGHLTSSSPPSSCCSPCTGPP